MESKIGPLVSIIVNCFNGEKYLRKALDSILNQTYKNWEIIFWDNQSTDQSSKIFKSYKDQRFKYFYAFNHTLLYKARNEAIKKASGEFLAFLDVDDWWEKDKLELQIPLFNDSGVGLVYGNHYIFNEKVNKKTIFIKRKLPKGFILNNLLKKYHIGILTVVIRKSCLKNQISPFNEKFHIIGDFDLIIKMSEKHKFDCVQKSIASYRLHEKNESLLQDSRYIEELKYWYKEMLGSSEISKNTNFKNVINIINFIEVKNYIHKNDIKKARILMKKIPISIKKIKYMIALLLPNYFLKRFI